MLPPVSRFTQLPLLASRGPSMLSVFFFLLITNELMSCSWSAHVLLMPFPYRSHVTEISSIGKGLLERGHRITILLSESYPELDQVRQKSGFQVVEYAVADRDFYTMDATNESADWVSVALEMDPIDELRTNVDGFIQFCTNPLADQSLPDRLMRSSHGRPDLAVVDGFPNQRCLWIICHRLGIPYVSLTTQYEPWLWRTPALSSFVPFPFAAGGRLTERMTFWERVENLRSLIDWTAWPRLEVVEDRFLQRYAPDETYSSLASRSLLWLFDTDLTVDYARPTMPNEINIGGLSTSPARPLPEGPLETFARLSVNKLVVVSFGSIDVASGRYFDQLFNAFREVSELNFVWRYDGEIPAKYSSDKSWPTNILTQKWLPQNDLLGYNNTVLFVSHCGANSQYEAVYHGVPMICLAIWGDQMYNGQRMQYRGYGIHLGRFAHVTSDRLTKTIRQVAFNRTYADNMRRASAIFKSRPMNGRQTAVWWIEHVIQYGGSHLHSHAADMVWYEYLMLDILAVFVVLPVAVIASCSTAFVCCLLNRRKFQNAEQPRTEKKRQ